MLSFWVGEVSALAALEEAGADMAPGGAWKVVEVGVAVETDFVEEEGPAVPGAIVLVVCPCCLGVIYSCFRVTVEKIQEEISLGRGTIRKFAGTWDGKLERMKDVRSGGERSKLRERVSATEL